MARKSRKNISDRQIEILNIAQYIRTAEYVRLSVEDNDTLWSLADRYNNGNEDTTSYINNIMQMNDLSSDTIHSGKNLVIYYYSTEVR